VKLTLAKIAEWTGGSLHGTGETEATGYSIDTRTLLRGDVFFAVSGERFDAHTFVDQAFARGTIAAVVAEEKVARLGGDGPLIGVDDPLLALQRLAARVRKHWGRRVVAITGSAGKTTTKEMVAAVLSARLQVLKSAGNLNNHFGVPLQLLRLDAEHDVAVIEMGMSNAGEIALLAKIASPDWGVLTNIGNAHAENFSDGIAGIARAKFELIDALPAGGIAFLNADDQNIVERIAAAAPRARVVWFGRDKLDIQAFAIEDLGSEGLRMKVRADRDTVDVHLRLLGRHNVANALSALAVGLESGISLAEGAAALAALTPGDKRGQLIELASGAKVINDSYNSNPEALKSMIRTLAGVAAERRILVAGEMLELGPESERLHAECGALASELGLDVIIGVRGLARALAAAAGLQAIFLDTPEQAGAWLAANLRFGDVALLKGSRGVRLERALDSLLDSTAGPALR
jgi:UDP-N-acetylmuramoyl-tripeptide--D-alanyl-D-alanine ligase